MAATPEELIDVVVYPDYTPATMPPRAEVAQAWGVQVSYAPITRNAYGSYNQATDSIQMATHDVVSFFHELIHAGQKRALEARGRKLAPGQDPQQEIVAEAGAAALCILYGYEGFLVDSRTYVAHYAGVQDDPTKAAKAVLGTLNDIAEVLTLILDTAQAQAEQVAA